VFKCSGISVQLAPESVFKCFRNQCSSRSGIRNKAEASLRRVALGRSNFLFVGHEDAGKNLAIGYTLVATCEQHGVNPIDYLTDVLTRVQKHPASRVTDLLPQHWKPPDG
jgi:hypothetical protein